MVASTACGTGPIAACCITARTSFHSHPERGTSCWRWPAASLASTESQGTCTTPADGKPRSSITCRCSGRRAVSWLMRPGSRSSDSGPIATVSCASCNSCGQPSTPAPRRDRCSRTTITSSCRRRRWLATSQCSSAAAGSSGSWRGRSLRRSSRSGRSRTFPRRTPGDGPPERAAGSG